MEMSPALTKFKEEVTERLNKARETTREFGFFDTAWCGQDEILLVLASGDPVDNPAVELFFYPIEWEKVHSDNEDRDYRWEFFTVYKLKKQIKWGNYPEFVEVYVKFSGVGRSYDGDVYTGWKFVEPKVKTVEVWE